MSVPASWVAVEDAIAAWVFAGSGLPVGRVIWAQQAGDRPPAAPWIAMRLLALTPHGIDYDEQVEQVLAVADDDVETVTAGADTLTLTGHGYQTGDGPVRFTTTGTLPAGLELATDYWLEVIDVDTVRVAATFPDAMNGDPIDITDAGSGTHTISTTADTRRQGEEVLDRVRGSRIATLALQCFGGGATGATAPAMLLDAVGAAAALPSVMAALGAADVGVIELGAVQSIDGLVGEALFEPRAVAQHRLHLPLELAAAAPSTVIEYVTVTGPEQAVSVPEDPT